MIMSFSPRSGKHRTCRSAQAPLRDGDITLFRWVGGKCKPIVSIHSRDIFELDEAVNSVVGDTFEWNDLRFDVVHMVLTGSIKCWLHRLSHPEPKALENISTLKNGSILKSLVTAVLMRQVMETNGWKVI